MKRSAIVLSAAALAATLCACGGDGDKASTQVIAWNRFASDLVAANGSPAAQVRNMALVQTAVHDALNAIEPRYEAYAHEASAPGASPAAAVAAASRETLLQLLPSAAAAIDAFYDAQLAGIAQGAARSEGITTGRAAAATILARRSADDIDAATFKAYVVREPAPGVYQPTAPIVIGAGLGELEPFAVGAIAAFRSPAPLAVSSSNYAADYEEVKTLGSASSTTRTTRTAQQEQTARFWFDAATREWHGAARQGLQSQAADEWQAARTLALLGIAMFDATVASMETKFHFDYWRPVTAVQRGDDDGNDATVGDATWQPLCGTPPFPEHNSTHAATGAAAAGVLARTLGDEQTFTVASPTLPGVTRSYSRFSDAALEEGLSRIYCGIHFRNGMNAGLQQGDAVGARVVQHLSPR